MWPIPQFSAGLVTFTEESLMENFIFCAVQLPCALQTGFSKSTETVQGKYQVGVLLQ